MKSKRTRRALRYIPFRKQDILEMCLADDTLGEADQQQFRSLVKLLQSVFHFEYHDNLEVLKNSFAPFNPERDTRRMELFGDAPDDLVGSLETLLNHANYERLTDQELRLAFQQASLFKLRLHLDFRDFDEVLVFARGESIREESVRAWHGLWQRQFKFSSYNRVVLFIRFGKDMKAVGDHPPGSVLLKMFQHVPKADIEMLFPNVRLGMRMVDKLLIGVPAVLGGGIVLTTNVGTSFLLLGTLLGFWFGLNSRPVELTQTAIIALVAALGGLGSFIWKQFVNFKNHKLTYMQNLTENLYVRNLASNAGVFHRLLDDAEEEECKEAVLAYYFLLARPEVQTRDQLDSVIERWFRDVWQSEVNFEIDDAVRKLIEFGLVAESESRLTVTSLPACLQALDQRWDTYFAYSSMAETD